MVVTELILHLPSMVLPEQHYTETKFGSLQIRSNASTSANIRSMRCGPLRVVRHDRVAYSQQLQVFCGGNHDAWDYPDFQLLSSFNNRFCRHSWIANLGLLHFSSLGRFRHACEEMDEVQLQRTGSPLSGHRPQPEVLLLLQSFREESVNNPFLFHQWNPIEHDWF